MNTLVDYRNWIPADSSSVLLTAVGQSRAIAAQLRGYLRFINPSAKVVVAEAEALKRESLGETRGFDCVIAALTRQDLRGATGANASAKRRSIHPTGHPTGHSTGIPLKDLTRFLKEKAPLLALSQDSNAQQIAEALHGAGLQIYAERDDVQPADDSRLLSDEPAQPDELAPSDDAPPPRAWSLCCATRAAPRPIRLFHVFSPMAAGVNHVRTHLPARFMASIPGVQVGLPPRHLPVQEQAIIYQRQTLSAEKGFLGHAQARARNALLIYETDDHPGAWPRNLANNHLPLRVFHCAQTSTPALARELRRFMPEVAVFPNQLAGVPAERQAKQPGSVRLFFGALNREREARAMLPEVNRVLQSARCQVQFTVIHAREFFEGLATDQKQFVELCDYPTYLDHLRQADVALLPLFDTLFNRCKSDLKFIECAANGVAVLASPTVYAESIAHAETGLLFGNPKQFREHLEHLLHDHQLRQRLVDSAFNYVAAQRLMAHQVRQRYDWYCSMLDRRDELDAALTVRAPELAPFREKAEGELVQLSRAFEN